jgi:hypothetical protein
MEKVIVRSSQIEEEKTKIEEKCLKCGKFYVDSLYCWPSSDGNGPNQCEKDSIYVRRLEIGTDFVRPRVVH